jgi:mono/diheme cytochrome c family protein
MKKSNIKVALFVIGLALCGSALLAQQKSDVGKREFEANCESCHGVDGKGFGSLVDLLRSKPTDLTALTKQNKGIFPMRRIYEVIEGANVPSHGSRDMPVWGREFRLKDAEYYHEAHGLYDAEAAVRARILALLEYISRLQVP